MNLVNECERNLINSRDVAKESEDESSSRSGWLSWDVDSSDENSAENVYEDCYLARNYWDRQKSIAHKAILDRAYNFIYDEAFSSETTTESDIAVGNYSSKNYWARNLVLGDAEDYLRMRNPITKCRSKDSNRLELRQGDVRNQQNTPENRRNFKALSSSRSFAKNMQNFEEWRSTKIEDNSESLFRNTSRFQSSDKNCKQSFSDSSDFLSETSDFEKSFGNESRRFFSRKYSKKYPNLGTVAIPRKRKLSSMNFNLQDRSNHSQGGRNAEICESENPLSRISRSSKLSDRPKLISKMRKIYSEQILIDELSEKNKQLLFSEVDSSSSDDSLLIDVEEILQENLRGNNTRFTVETILLERKDRVDFDFPSFHETSSRSRDLFSRGSSTSETHSNEMKLLGDIKKRIDEDFAVEKIAEAALTDSSKSSEDRKMSLKIESKAFLEMNSSPRFKLRHKITEEKVSPVISNQKSLTSDKASGYFVKNIEITDSVNNTSSKSSRQYFVDSIDSGVSTDFSRNESDLSRTDNYPKIENDSRNSEVVESQILREEETCLALVSSSNYSEADEEEILAEEVEKAVQKFTEELIMCERRAVGRGLVDEIRRGRGARKRKKPFQQARYSGSSSSPKSGKTISSPREFLKTSQSSSEEEYLENISPPSLCSMSDSDSENLLYLYD